MDAQNQREDTIPLFLAFCIEQYKHAHAISGEEAAKVLNGFWRIFTNISLTINKTRMTELYHGGLEIIPSPEIRIPNRTLDFGHGFYLTSSATQAEDWVRRRMENNTYFIHRKH